MGVHFRGTSFLAAVFARRFWWVHAALFFATSQHGSKKHHSMDSFFLLFFLNSRLVEWKVATVCAFACARVHLVSITGSFMVGSMSSYEEKMSTFDRLL